MLRFLLAAAVLPIAFASAEARPAWRSVPTPLPPEIHLSKVRPPYVGPVWRHWDWPSTAADVAPTSDDAADTSVVTLEPDTAIADPPVVAEAAPSPAPPAPVNPIPAVETTVATRPVVAKAPEPEPPVAAVVKPVVAPAPVVVAENTLEPKPTALPAPATQAQSRQTPWLDYMGAFVMAIVVGAAIFFLSRDRKRLA